MAKPEDEIDVLGGYVRTILERTGWSQAKLAKKAGVDPGTVSRMKNGERQTRRGTLEALERASGVILPPELRSAGEADMAGVSFAPEKPDRVSVFALIGAPGGDWYRNEAQPDAVPRPPSLAEARAVWAVRMPNTSMRPWRRPNELLFINPQWAVEEGDNVIVEMNHPHDDNHSRSIYRIRRFLGMSRNGRRFAVYNPEREESIPDSLFVNMYRVLEWPEVAGLR